jgi:hypothetical protein
MCQKCVEEGFLTQAELDRALAKGDRTVRPIDELSLPDFIEAAADKMATALQAGADVEATILAGMDLLDLYQEMRVRSGSPITDEELATIMNDPRLKSLWS